MTTAAEVIGKIRIAGTDRTIEPVLKQGSIDVDATMARVKGAIASLQASLPYVFKVNGKIIGSKDLPGLTLNRARVLFAEYLDRANDANSVYRSELRYSHFGVFKRDSNGKLSPVAELQHRAESTKELRNYRPKWVK
jgi:hypothetical protein